MEISADKAKLALDAVEDSKTVKKPRANSDSRKTAAHFMYTNTSGQYRCFRFFNSRKS